MTVAATKTSLKIKSVFMLLQSLLRLLHLVHFVKCQDGGVVRLHVKPWVIFFTPPAQVGSPTWGLHLHVND